jgi:hypothetical protein
MVVQRFDGDKRNGEVDAETPAVGFLLNTARRFADLRLVI